MPLDFNGTTQAAYMGLSIPSLNAATQWTFMAWVFSDAAVIVDRDILSLAIGPPPGTSATSRAGIAADPGDIGNTFNRDGDAEAAQTVNTAAGFISVAAWFHYAMTVDIPTDTVRIYKDGVLNTTGVVAFVAGAASATNSKNGAFGADDIGTGLFFDGKLDDVRIYSRRLSTEEIAEIVRLRGKDQNYVGLEQRYLCREGAPGAASGVGTIKDVARQQRNCDGLNAPVYSSGILNYGKRQS